MTPLDFLRWYEFDERVLWGDYYPSSPLEVQEGERVGVVLLSRGGPAALDDVESVLYNRYMDPARYELPVGGVLRHWMCRALASLRASSVREKYELIGGRSPLTRLTREQANSLQCHLNDHYGDPAGVDFRTYVAMRYWHPFGEEAAERMVDDDVDRVVLLPLYPQYSKTTSGSSLAYWRALEDTGEIPSWPTTKVFEYATNPKFVRALSERIDEGLQRFPREERSEVQVVFSARGTSLRDREQRKDPYCCLVHSTVEQVMQQRDDDRSVYTSFQRQPGFREGLSPTTDKTLDMLGRKGAHSVLVVPVSFVTDRLETTYDLDIDVRRTAETAGIRRFEVTSALNTHPLFVEALGEATVAQLKLPVDVNQLRLGGDGMSQDYPLRPLEDMPQYGAEQRDTRCGGCSCITEARQWTLAEDEPGADAVRTGGKSDSREASEESSGSRSTSS